MSRYLFAIWDGGGAVAPELGVARRLIENGHQVRVLADPTLRAQVAAVGATFSPWVRTPHRTSNDPSGDVVKDWEVRTPFEGLRRMRDRLIGGPAELVASETAEQIGDYSPDALMADYFMFGAMIAAQGAGLPVAAVMPNIWALPVRGVPPIAAGFPLAQGVPGRVRDAMLIALVNRVFAKGLPALNQVRDRHGLRPLRSFYDQVLGVDRIFVLSSSTFDYASPFVPANVSYAGPVLDEPQWAVPWVPPWSEDDARPLILVGLSSTFQNQGDLLPRRHSSQDRPPRCRRTAGSQRVGGENPACSGGSAGTGQLPARGCPTFLVHYCRACVQPAGGRTWVPGKQAEPATPALLGVSPSAGANAGLLIARESRCVVQPPHARPELRCGA